MSGYDNNSLSGLPLFDREEGARLGDGAASLAPHRPISRRDDPATSKQAEQALRTSGKLSGQCAEALAALTAFIAANGYEPTSAELAGEDVAKRFLYAKRLPLLRPKYVQNGPPRLCNATGSRAMTWRPR